MSRIVQCLRGRVVLAGVIASALGVTSASALVAQDPPRPPAQRVEPPRRGEAIEIRGQVPTPQVVTVRPREAPTYSRRVLVPGLLDRSFWPSILPPLQIVSPVATPRADSTSRSTADSASRRLPAAPRPPSGTPPASLRR